MNSTGWLFMFVSIGMVLSLVGFCFKKMLTLPPSEAEDLNAPGTIDTKDLVDKD